MGGEAGRAPSGGLRSCACSRTGWGRHHHPRNHVLKKLKVRRGCTVPSPLTWPSTKKSDSTEKLATIGSVDGCSVLPETRLCVDTTWVLSVWGSTMGAIGEARVQHQTIFRDCTPNFSLKVISRSFFHKGILPQDSKHLKSDSPR